MAYKCLECGHIFEEGEQENWLESRGEYWGTPCSEEMSGCPLCHGEYEETVQCSVCGAEHIEDELEGGVCEDCIDLYKYDVNMCFRIGEKEPMEIELNSFLTSMYSVDEIEALLWHDILKTQKLCAVDCTPFIEADRIWFAENLSKEVNNYENGKE